MNRRNASMRKYAAGFASPLAHRLGIIVSTLLYLFHLLIASFRPTPAEQTHSMLNLLAISSSMYKNFVFHQVSL